MKKSKSKTSKSFVQTLSMNNSSSFIQCPDGTIKRRRRKQSYKDIYLERLNFIPTQMPASKGRDSNYSTLYQNNSVNISRDSYKFNPDESDSNRKRYKSSANLNKQFGKNLNEKSNASIENTPKNLKKNSSSKTGINRQDKKRSLTYNATGPLKAKPRKQNEMILGSLGQNQLSDYEDELNFSKKSNNESINANKLENKDLIPNIDLGSIEVEEHDDHNDFIKGGQSPIRKNPDDNDKGDVEEIKNLENKLHNAISESDSMFSPLKYIGTDNNTVVNSDNKNQYITSRSSNTIEQIKNEIKANMEYNKKESGKPAIDRKEFEENAQKEINELQEKIQKFMDNYSKKGEFDDDIIPAIEAIYGKYGILKRKKKNEEKYEDMTLALRSKIGEMKSMIEKDSARKKETQKLEDILQKYAQDEKNNKITILSDNMKLPFKDGYIGINTEHTERDLNSNGGTIRTNDNNSDNLEARDAKGNLYSKTSTLGSVEERIKGTGTTLDNKNSKRDTLSNQDENIISQKGDEIDSGNKEETKVLTGMINTDPSNVSNNAEALLVSKSKELEKNPAASTGGFKEIDNNQEGNKSISDDENQKDNDNSKEYSKKITFGLPQDENLKEEELTEIDKAENGQDLIQQTPSNVYTESPSDKSSQINPKKIILTSTEKKDNTLTYSSTATPIPAGGKHKSLTKIISDTNTPASGKNSTKTKNVFESERNPTESDADNKGDLNERVNISNSSEKDEIKNYIITSGESERQGTNQNVKNGDEISEKDVFEISDNDSDGKFKYSPLGSSANKREGEEDVENLNNQMFTDESGQNLKLSANGMKTSVSNSLKLSQSVGEKNQSEGEQNNNNEMGLDDEEYDDNYDNDDDENVKEYRERHHYNEIKEVDEENEESFRNSQNGFSKRKKTGDSYKFDDENDLELSPDNEKLKGSGVFRGKKSTGSKDELTFKNNSGVNSGTNSLAISAAGEMSSSRTDMERLMEIQRMMKHNSLTPEGVSTESQGKMKLEELLLHQNDEKEKQENEKKAQEELEKKEKEDQARKEREEAERIALEEKMKKEKEEQLRKEREEQIRKEKEEKLRREKEEQIRKEKEEQIRKEKEEQIRREKEEKLRKEKEEQIRKEKEEQMRKEKEEQQLREEAKIKALKEKIKKEKEELRKQKEEAERKALEEKAKKEKEEQLKKEQEEKERIRLEQIELEKRKAEKMELERRKAEIELEKKRIAEEQRLIKEREEQERKENEKKKEEELKKAELEKEKEEEKRKAARLEKNIPKKRNSKYSTPQEEEENEDRIQPSRSNSSNRGETSLEAAHASKVLNYPTFREGLNNFNNKVSSDYHENEIDSLNNPAFTNQYQQNFEHGDLNEMKKERENHKKFEQQGYGKNYNISGLPHNANTFVGDDEFDDEFWNPKPQPQNNTANSSGHKVGVQDQNEGEHSVEQKPNSPPNYEISQINLTIKEGKKNPEMTLTKEQSFHVPRLVTETVNEGTNTNKAPRTLSNEFGIYKSNKLSSGPLPSNKEPSANQSPRNRLSSNVGTTIVNTHGDIDNFIQNMKMRNKTKSSTLSDIYNKGEMELKQLKEKGEYFAKQRMDAQKKKFGINSNGGGMEGNTIDKETRIRKFEMNNNDYDNGPIPDIDYNNIQVTATDEGYKRKTYVSIFDSMSGNKKNSNLNTLSNQERKESNGNNINDIEKIGFVQEEDFYNIDKYENLRNRNKIQQTNDWFSKEKKKVKDKNMYLNKVKEDVKSIEISKKFKESYIKDNINLLNMKNNNNNGQVRQRPKFVSNVIMPVNTLEDVIEAQDSYFLNSKI